MPASLDIKAHYVSVLSVKSTAMSLLMSATILSYQTGRTSCAVVSSGSDWSWRILENSYNDLYEFWLKNSGDIELKLEWIGGSLDFHYNVHVCHSALHIAVVIHAHVYHITSFIIYSLCLHVWPFFLLWGLQWELTFWLKKSRDGNTFNWKAW